MKTNESKIEIGRKITPLLGSTPRPKATREYSVIIWRPGYRDEVWPPMAWRSNQRIRAFAHTMFQKWFGRTADDRTRSWHMDGFMAECADRRGFIVQVQQINHGDPRFRMLPTPWTKERIEAQFAGLMERKAS